MARNREDIYRMNGCSNHSDTVREENDFYSTDPDCVKDLLEVEKFDKYILEPCCGSGNISKVLEEYGYSVLSTDLIDRGYGKSNIDFFDYKTIDRDIITNPPYSLTTEFIDRALDIITPNHKIALFLKLNFLEGVERYQKIFSRQKLKTVYVYSKRVACYKNDEMYQKDKDGNILLDSQGKPKKIGSAVAFCWAIFDTEYCGFPTIKWLNVPEEKPVFEKLF